MATLSDRKNGRWIVRWDRNRSSVTFVDMSRRQALDARRHLEHLVECAERKTPPDRRTMDWIALLPPVTHGKLAELGLCSHRFTEECRTVQGICEHFLAWKRDSGAAASSMVVYRNATKLITEFFKPAKDVKMITPSDMDDFIRWVYTKCGLAKTTASRRIQTAQSVFRRAARQRWISRDDFHDLFENVPKQTRTNPKRQKWIDTTPIELAIEHALNNEQRLIFALGRWCGLRMPSELLQLAWDDVDWQNEKLTIRSPKQENHEHRRERIIPIWPEVRKYLDIAWDEAVTGQVHVIKRYRSKSTASHSGLFTRACCRAGIVSHPRERPWPKLWINMRSTRVTELRSEFPADAVNYWMNHSEQVSKQHYQQWETFEWRS